MKFYFIVQMALIMLTIVRENHSSILISGIWKEEVGCYKDSPQTLEIICQDKEIRVLRIRQLFYDCLNTETNRATCCPYGHNIDTLLQPNCEEDIYKFNESKYQYFVQKCSATEKCCILVNQTQNVSTHCQSLRYQYSNHIAVNYACVSGNNSMNFCGQFIKKHLAHGFIETTNYPQMHNERSCWCLLNATAPITKFKIVQANNTNAEFKLSYFGSSYEDIQPMDGSYIVNQNVTNLSIQSALINTGTLAPRQLSIYFELQDTSMVQFQCWNGTMPPIATTISTVNTKSTTTTGSDLGPIVGGTLGSIVILVIITFITVMVVRSYRKKSKASKQPSTQIDGDPNYHDISDLHSGTTNLQMTTFDDTETYEELPDNSQYTNTYSSLSHDSHHAHLKQDKTNQNQKSSMSTQSKTCSNKSTNEMPEYAKVNKKKEPTDFEFESEDTTGDTPTKKPVYAKVNKRKTDPNFFELDPQHNRTASKDDQHDYFEKNKTDFQISNPTHFEIESGFAGGAVHSKADETDYAYTYAHFNRDPSKKGTQEHADDDDADKVIFTDNDIYDTDKVEFIDNDVYNTS